MIDPPNRMVDLDGYTYLGFFQRVIFPEKHCRACHRTAVGYCAIMGRGEEHLLRLCEFCAQIADEHMKKSRLRRRLTDEEKRVIITDESATHEIAIRMGVSTSHVAKTKLKARGIALPSPVKKKVPTETRIAIQNADGRTCDLARQYGLHPDTVSRIRHGK